MGAGGGGGLRPLRKGLLLFVLAVAASACSPIYVLRAGWAEARILAARRPIGEVLQDPATSERTRMQLSLVLDARSFAADSLGLDVGDSYTTFTRLESDTLALVLSAAHRDRLAFRTWWFPVVGRVPYRGFFSEAQALGEQAELEEEGFDTYLRPTAAFSTLGWFSDPLLSTLLRYDDVELAATVIHELTHNHLFIPGHVRFNESLATFVGRVGAIEYFCGRGGDHDDTLRCRRARERWDDAMRFSTFLDGLVEELEALYARGDLDRAEVLRRRAAVFRESRRRFREEVQPGLRSLTFESFLSIPLNNATLLARMLYYHRLPDFQGLLETREGSLEETVAWLTDRADGVDDPWSLLPEGRSTAESSSADVRGDVSQARAVLDDPLRLLAAYDRTARAGPSTERVAGDLPLWSPAFLDRIGAR